MVTSRFFFFSLWGSSAQQLSVFSPQLTGLFRLHPATFFPTLYFHEFRYRALFLLLPLPSLCFFLFIVSFFFSSLFFTFFISTQKTQDAALTTSVDFGILYWYQHPGYPADSLERVIAPLFIPSPPSFIWAFLQFAWSNQKWGNSVSILHRHSLAPTYLWKEKNVPYVALHQFAGCFLSTLVSHLSFSSFPARDRKKKDAKEIKNHGVNNIDSLILPTRQRVFLSP